MKSILTSIVALIATFLFFSNAATAQATDSVKTATVKVGNLHCNGDMPTIKKRLLNQDGIDDVAFTERDDEMATFTVTYHTSVTNHAAIQKSIESTPGCDDQSETPYRVVEDRPRKKKKG